MTRQMFAAFAMTTLLSGAAGAVASAQENRGDATLDRTIEGRIRGDASLAKRDIDVTVERVVVLKGSVATDEERRRAEELARVDGIERVDNRIQVDDRSAGDKADKPGVVNRVGDRVGEVVSATGEVITDGWITMMIKANYFGEDSLKNSDINVDTNNQIVTLKGRVSSAAGRARAMAIAKETKGVKSVVDQLVVAPLPPR